MEPEELVHIAHGEQPADLLLHNARLVNVYTGEIYLTDIAIAGEQIAAIGPGYTAKETLDLEGRYVCPGFIDAHVHIESSMVPPREFARVVLPHGVTTVISDPHEIANVLGLEGIRFMLQDAKYGPLSMFVDAPSCVPASHMETSGSQLEFYDLATLLGNAWVIGLGEVMNYPGVIKGDRRVLQKILAFSGKIIDGHAPGIAGMDLNAYCAAGIGSDHECTTLEEALAKLRLGMTIFVREATNARNLEPLIGLFRPEFASRICLCTDDRHPHDLIDEGSIDHVIRSAIKLGVDPILAIRAGTLNPAEYFRLYDRGAIAPGKRADLVIFSDLEDLRPEKVYRGGRLAAQEGRMQPWEQPLKGTKARGTINVRWDSLDFRIPAQSEQIRVIGMIPNQLGTDNLVMPARIVDGCAVADPTRDLAKLLVVERHFGTGRKGMGFIQGLGLKTGAIAGTVAHDHHNIVAAGMDDESLVLAVREIANMQGGMVVASRDGILARLPLPIAGLMSDQPIAIVRSLYDQLAAAAASLGSTLHDPFMALSFMALSVIPSLKLTDMGLVAVDQFELTSLFVE
ncbi:MAG: adenine deaminase [Anaerolineaceae bacterium]|nr:adenine deaminase [Anaerolineaceae bacterium]